MPLATDVVILNGDTAVSATNPLPTTATISGSITVNSAAEATAAPPSYGEGTQQPLSQNLTGDLRTISKQSGVWTVQPGNTANTTAWLVTGTGGVFPASQSGSWTVTAAQATAASLNATVVGTGTFAVQAAQSGTWTVTGSGGVFPVTQTTSPWIVAGQGTAGTAASAVMTVQGIASMTPVQVSQATAGNLNATVIGTGTFATQSAITAASGAIASGAVASGAFASGALASGSIASGAMVDLVAEQTPVSPTTATATKGLLVGGQYNSTQATFTNGQQGAYQISSRGELKSNIMDAAGNARGVNVNASNQLSVSVDNTITVATHAVTIASGGVASGAYASGSIASGAYASGAIGSGAIASGAVASGAYASGAFASGAFASGSFASGSQNVGITPTDRTITSMSGSSQQLMAANASRKSLNIMNTGTSNIGVNPTGGTAVIGGAGTLTIVPQGAYTPRVPTLSAINVIGTAAQPVYGDEA